MQAVHPGFTAQRDAAHAADGLRRTLTVSFGLHIGVVAALFLLPHDWFVKEQPIQIPISLAMGTVGEKTGGLNPAGARPVEEVAPPPKRPAPQQIATPAPREAIAVSSKPAKTPPKPADPAPVPQAQRPPVTGAKVTTGSAPAAVGSSQGTGLSVGGGAGGTSATFDSNFCCTAYAQEVLRRIEAKWNKPGTGEVGETTLVFEIRRDGSFTKPVVEKSSGSTMLDLAAQAAFLGLQLPGLPEQYTNETLKIHLVFPYKR